MTNEEVNRTMLNALKEIVNTKHICYAENHLIAIAQAAIDAVEGKEVGK